MQKQITFAERYTILNTFGEHFDTKFYGIDDMEFETAVKKMGPVHYKDEMSAVFRFSKLNLCPTIRSITTGIPLRALDIMAAGGALFSNYQAELAETFRDGKDCIMYSGLEDAYDKAVYYLEHEKEIEKIARSGHDIVAKDFGFERRLESMLGMVSE